ncbi:hypothetical protein A9Q91_06115 [Candidatus Gracilibacteria bacterium 28_42_T64]|nr:hypothetical protein A9Q91_06115 [Candidatus Gracilibacteria bacterium 28_42_T64]
MLFTKRKKKAETTSDNSSNIFEEFESNTDLKQEIDEMNKQKDKDGIYYVSIFGSFLQTVFFIWLFIAGLLYGYLYIQTNEEIRELTTLDPVCSVVLGDLHAGASYCSSVSFLYTDYTDQLKKLKDNQVKKVLEVLGGLYKVENFTKSKHIIFLENKSNNKLRVLEILEKFDALKNSYDPIEIEKIQCSDIEINKKEVITLKCEAYSIGYENGGIKGFDGTDNSNVGGTSISIANSFLNYIERNGNDFTLIDRQKIFSSENIFGESTGFTKKTQFDIKLQYNSNNLSL